jgi:hypothetical protein
VDKKIILQLGQQARSLEILAALREIDTCFFDEAPHSRSLPLFM